MECFHILTKAKLHIKSYVNHFKLTWQYFTDISGVKEKKHRPGMGESFDGNLIFFSLRKVQYLTVLIRLIEKYNIQQS